MFNAYKIASYETQNTKKSIFTLHKIKKEKKNLDKNRYTLFKDTNKRIDKRKKNNQIIRNGDVVKVISCNKFGWCTVDGMSYINCDENGFCKTEKIYIDKYKFSSTDGIMYKANTGTRYYKKSNLLASYTKEESNSNDTYDKRIKKERQYSDDNLDEERQYSDDNLDEERQYSDDNLDEERSIKKKNDKLEFVLENPYYIFVSTGLSAINIKANIDKNLLTKNALNTSGKDVDFGLGYKHDKNLFTAINAQKTFLENDDSIISYYVNTNLMYNGTSYQPYIGLLAGYSQLAWNTSAIKNASKQTLKKGSLLYGAQLGMVKRITPSLGLFAQYQLMNFDHNLSINNGKSSINYASQTNFTFGLRYEF
ncbi:hypothetical protein MNB_ARC-1_331 [hydrothermal vent metagenome]|uniref:Outer membrane protein beta-barrel domain-containing protein n=1 Tax=hydrothermal vent metagenome TaxID=652676 RepID=A0A3B1E5A0_9ZZZZ